MEFFFLVVVAGRQSRSYQLQQVLFVVPSNKKTKPTPHCFEKYYYYKYYYYQYYYY